MKKTGKDDRAAAKAKSAAANNKSAAAKDKSAEDKSATAKDKKQKNVTDAMSLSLIDAAKMIKMACDRSMVIQLNQKYATSDEDLQVRQ